MSRQRSGLAFTLIELLVVVSIVALLVALLLPALGNAKQMTQVVLCGTSLRQVGTAMIAYTQNYQQFMPGPVNGRVVHVDPNWPDGQLATIMQKELGGYKNALRAFNCPTMAAVANPLIPHDRYILNNNGVSADAPLPPIFGSKVSTPQYPPVKLTEIRTKLPLLTDIDQFIYNWVLYPPLPIHPGQTRNYLFVDGSVKRIVPSALPLQQWNVQ